MGTKIASTKFTPIVGHHTSVCPKTPRSSSPDSHIGIIHREDEPAYPDDNIHFRWIYPNGGEVFRVGDTMDIRVCSEDPDLHLLGEAAIEITVDGGVRWLTVTGSPNEDESVIGHVIPSHISVSTKTSTKYW